MSIKENQRYIYIPETKQRIPVTQEVYAAYYRPIWRTLDHARRHGQCGCADWRKCEGDCGLCRYQAAGDKLSLDYVTDGNDGEEITMGDSLVDPSGLIEDIVADSMLLDALTAELAELSPDAQQICQLYKSGHSERQIADLLGIPRSTFKRQWTSIKTQLLDRLKDYR